MSFDFAPGAILGLLGPKGACKTTTIRNLENHAGEEVVMFVLIRAVTWASLFIGLVLVFAPARVLFGAGPAQPPDPGWREAAGILITIAGAIIALWCVATFVVIGKGTPAPFDPPRRLVIRGPYRFVRNPMYLGAGLALGGAALVYRSLPLLGYMALLLVATHVFVVWYEEPTLRSTFGDAYAAYCARVHRWLPHI